MEEANLIAVETYIREDLPKILKNLVKEGEELSLKEKSFFFSTKYARNMADFKFMEGEKILIKEIVNHIKVKESSRAVDAADKKIEDDRKGTVETSIGLIFGENFEECQNKHKGAKDKLESLVARMTENYKTKYPSIVEIHENCIDLDVSSSDSIKAKVTCVFCKSNVNISCKKNGTWILSNLKRHFDSYCPKMEQKETQKMQSEIISSTDNSLEANNQDAAFTTQQNLFKTQLTLQSIQMSNMSFRNGDEGDDCETEMAPRIIAQIRVSKIPADGDCLIGAAVHQFYRVKIASDDYTKHVTQLRKNIVDHISNNLEQYERRLMDRIHVKEPKRAKEEKKGTVEKCKEFLDNYLAKKGRWCGSESMKAISELFETNIVVFSEGGHVYFGHPFDSSLKNVMMVAFRLPSQINTERNHYDSVIKLDESCIAVCSINLLLNNAKLCSLNQIDDVIALE